MHILKHYKYCFFLSFLLAINAQADAWDIERLMTALGSHREGRATFVETTYLSLLARPIESSGELMFAAPDQLQKLTLKPRREALLLKGDELTIERKGHKHILRISDYPQVAVFVDSIRSTLVGDRDALERAYRLSLSGGEPQWLLILTPKQQAANSISRISIAGANGSVDSVEIVQADGDRSVLRINNLAAPIRDGESTP